MKAIRKKRSHHWRKFAIPEILTFDFAFCVDIKFVGSHPTRSAAQLKLLDAVSVLNEKGNRCIDRLEPSRFRLDRDTGSPTIGREATSNAGVEFCAATIRTDRRSNAETIPILPPSCTVFIFKFRRLRKTECMIAALYPPLIEEFEGSFASFGPFFATVSSKVGIC